MNNTLRIPGASGGTLGTSGVKKDSAATIPKKVLKSLNALGESLVKKSASFNKKIPSSKARKTFEKKENSFEVTDVNDALKIAKQIKMDVSSFSGTQDNNTFNKATQAEKNSHHNIQP